MRRSQRRWTILPLGLLFGFSVQANDGGWFILRWIEAPVANQAASTAKSEELACFDLISSYTETQDRNNFPAVREQLQVGDVIAYHMDKWAARKGIFQGDLAKIGYRLLKYGHLAIVVRDPANSAARRLFSSHSFKGPNIREDIDSLAEHDWDCYRLDRWDRVDDERFHEFVALATKSAGKWYGYDFSGMFGLWNSNLRPDHPKNIGHDYICSTVVLAALYYSGLELDAIHRHGIADVVTPLQVVASTGRWIPTPSVSVQVESDAGAAQHAQKELPATSSFQELFYPNETYPYFDHAQRHSFEFAADSYRPVNAWWLAEASMLAYVRDRALVKKHLRAAGLPDVTFFGKASTQAFVAYNDDFILVVFRGTEPDALEDFFVDAQVQLVDFSGRGQVHRGFHNALRLIWPKVEKHLRRITTVNGPNRRLWFAGHSLGGALATLAAARFAEIGAVQGVYTYGSPRVGDHEFCARYSVPTYRIVNNNDVVPLLPPAWYRPVGTVTYIDSAGTVIHDPPVSTELKGHVEGHLAHALTVSKQWLSGTFGAVPNDNLVDHAPIHYAVKLWNDYVRPID